jgi:hypothetical protein
MNNMSIAICDVTRLLDKYRKKYEVMQDDGLLKRIRLYDNKNSNDFVTVEIIKDDGWRSISCAGKIIGDLTDLGKLLGN